MKIGIDARPLQHETQYRGIGKSLQFLLEALKPQLGSGDSLVFYLDKGLPKPQLLEDFADAKIITMPTARLGRKRYWRSFLASFKPLNPSRKDVDVVLQYDASFGVPKNVPCVVVFHDLIPYLFRGQEKQRPVKGLRKGKDALARNLYWQKYLKVLKTYKNAAKIIAISESSKLDLLSYISGVSADNIAVIPHGANFDKPSGKASLKIKKLAADPYLLFVGGIDIRKNIIGLLETFYQLKPAHPDLKLILVGKEFELSDRLEDLGWFSLLNKNPDYAKDVIKPGFVSHDDLAYLYSQADAFVFPSRYEGFGLPVLEAMGAGCPVVAYDNSSIPEVAGDAALIVKDGQPLAPVVEKLLSQPKLRQELVAKGYKQINKFSWPKTANKTLEILRHTASKS